ncbi:hypothetical protein [Sulfurimonas sp. HSL3-7]|uniref:hypothetical protein n=1 Tax=Sulfonitrofixus jiaomeiensis TaxID=3131938 RepID=UPI0031F9C07D
MHNESALEQNKYMQLQLEGDQLRFIASTGSGPAQSIHASVSRIRNALEQGKLTGARVEDAINQVEDLIMPILRSLPASTELRVSGLELVEIFHMLSATDNTVVPIASVESLFNQLADHAGGSPIAWHQAASPAHVALGLVVLREVMHHGGFGSVSLMIDTE